MAFRLYSCAMASDDNSSDYIVTMRGTLKPAPVTGPDPQSVFRAETTLSTHDIGEGVVIPEPSTDAYSPYAEKWKEFDRLKKTAKNAGVGSLLHWAWTVVIPLIGLASPHRVPRKDSVYTMAALGAVATVQLIRGQWAKNRLEHWPCPRCHSEWPGNKTEKDPQCAVCGLKLHQLTP
jgi:hypothetical protein